MTIENQLPVCDGEHLRHSLREARWWKQRVNSESESTIKHVCDDSLKDRTLSCFYARISVHFYKLNLKVIVKHEIIAKDFKTVASFVRIYILASCSKGVGYYSLDLGTEDVSLEIQSKFRIGLIKVELIISERDLVTYFMSPIVISLLLHSIIRQMNEFIA